MREAGRTSESRTTERERHAGKSIELKKSDLLHRLRTKHKVSTTTIHVLALEIRIISL